MSLLRHFKRLQYIDFLVSRKATGDLQTFADKNHLGGGGLLKVLKELREIGFPICYNRNLRTYYYEIDGHMAQSLFIENDAFETQQKNKKFRLNNFTREATLTREQMKIVSGTSIHNICFSKTNVFEKCTND